MFSPKITDGDLVVDENGNFIMAEDDEELAQSVMMALQTRKSEFFLEPDHGLIFDHLLGKEANQDEAYEDILEAVSQEERIASVKEITFNNNRKVRKQEVSLQLQKDDGGTLGIKEVTL